MANCEYVDKSVWLDGYHCKLAGRRIDDRSFVNTYCRSSVHCDECPIRNPNAGKRQEEQRTREEEQRREQAQREARKRREAEEYRTPVRSSGRRGYSGGGGSSSIGFLDVLGSVAHFGIMMLVVAVVVIILVFGSDFLGWMGPWVDMKLPDGTPTEGVSLYSVSRDEDTTFESRSGEFDQDGLAHVRFHTGYSDVYFARDCGGVWIGTCDLYTLNTAVVYDVTYEEIQSQMYRTLLADLVDSSGTPIVSGLTVTDAAGDACKCIDMGNGRYAVILPDEAITPVLTFQADGYAAYTVEMDMSGRLVTAMITLAAKENGV